MSDKVTCPYLLALQLKHSEPDFQQWYLFGGYNFMLVMCTSFPLQIIDTCRNGDRASVVNWNMCLFAPPKIDKTVKTEP